MLYQKLNLGIQKPLSVLGREQRGAILLQGKGQRVFLRQAQLNKRGPSRRYPLRVIAASNLSGMAQSVLSKPHRFILVSDLDWTMVRM